MASFVIKHAIYFLPTDYHPTLPFKNRAVLYAFQHAFQVYKTDIISLVAEAVEREVAEQMESYDLAHRAYAMERKTALEQWQRLQQPFGYLQDAYPLLVKAIRRNAKDLSEGLPLSHIGQKSISWFAEQLLDTVKTSKARISPPFWKTGKAFMTFQFAIKEAEQVLGISVEDRSSRESIIQLISKAVSFSKICNIPWSPDPTGAAGRPISTVHYLSWINLGQANPSKAKETEDPSLLALTKATQSAMAQDSQAEWSCSNLTVQNLHTVLNRQTLPTEWKLDGMSYGTGIVNNGITLRGYWMI
jgi:hypothetical protein